MIHSQWRTIEWRIGSALFIQSPHIEHHFPLLTQFMPPYSIAQLRKLTTQLNSNFDEKLSWKNFILSFIVMPSKHDSNEIFSIERDFLLLLDNFSYNFGNFFSNLLAAYSSSSTLVTTNKFCLLLLHSSLLVRFFGNCKLSDVSVEIRKYLYVCLCYKWLSFTKRR